MKRHSVTFIGAGNLAWHLAPALDNAGYTVRNIWSRNENNARALAEKLYECEVATSLDFSESIPGIFILAVTDDSIYGLVPKLLLPADSILVHTSGSQPLSVLREAATLRTGVFYPLQTFSRNRRIDFETVPVCIEGYDEATTDKLLAMAHAISKKVIAVSSEDRKGLHLAAVFASNFTNHMLTIAREIAKKTGLSYDLLKPLIVETLNKSLEIGPDNAQTGPAKRGDLEILDHHMEMLSDDESTAAIYRAISQHIIDYY